MPNKKTLAKVTLTIFFLGQFYGLSFFTPPKLESANLSTVSDTLSNNRLSFRGQVSGAHAAGSAAITLQTTPGSMATQNTSTGSAALMGNESVQVGTNNAPTTLKTIESASRIVMATGITNAVNDTDPVFSTASAIHTVRFTPVSTVANGAFRVLIPAASGNANDGIPDKNGFDFSASAPTVTCTGGSGMTFETGTATASAITISSQAYHSFECRYSGAGTSGTAVTMTIGTAAGNKIINPSPASSSRNPGQADTYTFRVRQSNGVSQSYSIVDETLGTIGVIEAVRVTATVAPILTFTLTGVAASTSTCGVNTVAVSTPISVPFGTLTANDASYNHMAQLLTVSTNASGGYSVTASESAALTAWNITGTPTIPNTTCQATPCTVSTPRTWTSASYTGFGYALQDVTGDAVPAGIEYTVGWRPFGLTAEQIMTDTTTVDADQAYVCYRAVISGSQAAGDYENYIIYIATATF